MRRLMVAFATALVAVGLTLPSLPAPAAESPLSALPGVGERGTLPGRTVEETVQIVNRSDREDYNVSASLTPLEVDGNGIFRSAESGASLPSAASWGVVEPATFVLARGHSQDVKIKFTPPKDTPGQGYFAAAKFAGAAPSGARTTTIHAVLLEVGGAQLVRSAKVASISAPSRSFGTTILVTVRLENTGNVAVMASGTVTLRDAAGNVSAEEPIARTPVIPGRPRLISVDMPAPLIPGRVRVGADFGFGEFVARDTATKSVLSITYWQMGALLLVVLLIAWAIRALVRWRGRRKAAKRRAPATIAAPAAAHAAAGTNGTPVAASPAQHPAPILADEEMQAFWEDETLLPRAAEPDAEPAEIKIATGPQTAPWASELAGLEDEDEIEEEVAEPAISPFAPAAEPELAPAVLAPEPEPEPEPMPAALTVVPPVAEPEPAEEPSGARVSALVERVKAGMPEGPAGGPQAGLRRALVALELMTERGARSAERIDVGLGLLRWTRGDEVTAAVEEAFDAAAAAGKKSAIAALALAMDEVGSSRATEALLRAYASSPRHLASRLRDALQRAPVEEFRNRSELLDALPADRRSALKVG